MTLGGENIGSSAQLPKRSMRWPIFVVGLLACHFLLMLCVAAIAVADPSFAVLPDYYRKALNWDKTQAAQRASDALGWKVRIEPSTTVDPLGRRAVTIFLTDAHDQPVPDAAVSMRYYHHSHAANAQTAIFKRTAPGHYSTVLPMRYSGLWQLELSAEAHGQDFYTSVTQQVNTESTR